MTTRRKAHTKPALAFEESLQPGESLDPDFLGKLLVTIFRPELEAIMLERRRQNMKEGAQP